MRSEQVYWVFTVSVDQMDKFKPLIPKLVAATRRSQARSVRSCEPSENGAS